MRRSVRPLVLATLLLMAFSATVVTQRGGAFGSRGIRVSENVPYNGHFTFTRVRYGGGLGFGGGAWSHDYPDADRNLPRILDAVTAIPTNLDGSNVLDLEDGDIFNHPILYVWEPGYWRISDAAATNLRSYMLKGGFVIFDDFEDTQWVNFEAQFRRALPEAVFVKLDMTHPIYHSFFDLDTLNLPHPTVHVTPGYYAVFEDNDPSKRMMALANHNSDIAEYWEWSGRGLFGVDTTNDAYKVGVNYIIYGLTH